MLVWRVVASCFALCASVHLNAQCTFAVSPDHLNFKADGEAKSVKVAASSSSCSLSGGAISDAAWLTPAGGRQNDNVSLFAFRAAANTGPSRTAIITVAGQKVLVVQASGSGASAPVGTPSITSAGILNGASFQGGGVAPGEILSIFGKNLGPDTATVLQIGADRVTIPAVLAATQVFFDGEPAPILFTSSGQISVIVPYTVAKKSIVNLRVEYGSTPSNIVSLPLSETSPSLFTVNGSGTGQGAILNKDNTVNSTKAPAHPGDTVTLFGTGGGLSNPFQPVNQLVPNIEPLPRLSLPVKVTVGGKVMTVTYAGGAPGLVPGLVQVNVTLSSGVPTGDSVPVVLTVGSGTSPGTVTAAIH